MVPVADVVRDAVLPEGLIGPSSFKSSWQAPVPALPRGTGALSWTILVFRPALTCGVPALSFRANSEQRPLGGLRGLP